MKITQLLNEMETPSSSTKNATNSAPKFGRSDTFLEDEQVEESSSGGTSSGSVASVSAPVGGMQRRGKGSMFAGIKTSSKFPNSQAVKEAQLDEVDPRNFDSDEDYYAARNAPAKARSHSRPSPGVNQDDEAYFREIFRKKRLAAQQAERNADHDRLATGTNESVGSDMQVWDVMIMNNFYSGKYPDYSARYYSVVAGSPEEARQVVLDNPDYVLQDLLSRKLQNGKKVLPRGSALPIEDKRVGGADRIKPGTITTMALKKMLTPDGVQSFKFTNGKIVDGSHVAGGEVEEARANTSGTRAGLAKRKTTVPLTPEEQQAKDAAKFEKWKAKNQKPEQKVAEGVAETMSMDEAKKVLRHYGADNFKTTSNELYFYKNGQQFSVDLTLGADSVRTVSVNQLNQAARQLKGQGVTEMDGDGAGRSGGEHGKEHTGKVMKAKDARSMAKKAWDYAIEPIHQAHDIIAKDRAKNIANIRKNREQGVAEEKQRLDPKCWSGYKKQGTKMKGDTRVNNCVKVDEAEFTEDKIAQDLYKDFQIFKKGADKDIGSKAKDKEISSKAKDKEIQKKK